MLAADVLYMSSLVSAVLKCVHAVLAEGGVAVLVDPGRPSAQDVPDALPEHGLQLVKHSTLRNVATAVTTLKLCHVFVVQRVDDGGVGLTESPSSARCRQGPLAAAALAAVNALERNRAETSPQGTAFGHRLM